MFSKLSKSFKGENRTSTGTLSNNFFSGSVSSLLSEDQPRSVGGGYGGGRAGTEVEGFTMGRRKERRKSRIFSQIFSSDAEDTKSDVPTRSMSMVRYFLIIFQFYNFPLLSTPCPWSL